MKFNYFDTQLTNIRELEFILSIKAKFNYIGSAA